MAKRTGWFAALVLLCTLAHTFYQHFEPTVSGATHIDLSRQKVDAKTRLTDQTSAHTKTRTAITEATVLLDAFLPNTHLPNTHLPNTLLSKTQAHRSLSPLSDPARLQDHDLDIPFIHSAFSSRDIDALLSHEQARIEIPGYGDFTLAMSAHHRQSETDFMTLAQPGSNLQTTLTRRGDTFYLTLATATGSFRIEGNNQGSRVFPHQLIAHRHIRHDRDYRDVPY